MLKLLVLAFFSFYFTAQFFIAFDKFTKVKDDASYFKELVGVIFHGAVIFIFLALIHLLSEVG